jgi:hypothetical protein
VVSKLPESSPVSDLVCKEQMDVLNFNVEIWGASLGNLKFQCRDLGCYQNLENRLGMLSISLLLISSAFKAFYK